ncbi:MAG TPA: potassium channel protein [Actinomycetota bacterium]|nr:potassium channel protein [Actinomycetota bacterium]
MATPVSSLPRRLAWVGAALAGLVVYGVIGYWRFEGWSFLDALYMTVTTLTTVGFREVRELDTSGRIFTLSLLVMGVAVLLTAISFTAAILAEAEIGGRSRRRRMERRIAAMHDHYIVCAYGRVGRAAVRELETAGVPFVVLDPNEELEERMHEDGVAYLIDDPSLEPALREAGVERARALLCAVDSDATNVYITLTARQMNPDLFIVARASEPGSTERLERAGADRVVSPYVSSGRHMVRMARDPAIVDVFDSGSSARRSVPVTERVVDEASDLRGRKVTDVGAPVLAIRRADGQTVRNPEATTTLEVGDVVLLLGS